MPFPAGAEGPRLPAPLSAPAGSGVVEALAVPTYKPQGIGTATTLSVEEQKHWNCGDVFEGYEYKNPTSEFCLNQQSGREGAARFPKRALRRL
jgi:hypothetical protein